MAQDVDQFRFQTTDELDLTRNDTKCDERWYLSSNLTLEQVLPLSLDYLVDGDCLRPNRSFTRRPKWQPSAVTRQRARQTYPPRDIS